jgi:hypothetical protein
MKIQLYIVSTARDITNCDFKLGITSNHISRLSTYRTSHPPRLATMPYYLAIAETCGTKQQSLMLDTYLKQTFAPYRINDDNYQNEWHHMDFQICIMLFMKFCYVNSLNFIEWAIPSPCDRSVINCIEIQQKLSKEANCAQWFLAHDMTFSAIEATQAINRIVHLGAVAQARALDIIMTGSVQPANFNLEPLIWHRINELSRIMLAHTGMTCKSGFEVSDMVTYLTEYNTAIASVRKAMHLPETLTNVKVYDLDTLCPEDDDIESQYSNSSDSNYRASEDEAPTSETDY